MRCSADFFDVDSRGLLVSEAYAESGPPRDLFVFDDQLHMVRGSRYDAAAPLRALAQGPTATSFKSNPLNPRGVKDEHGDAWGVWNRALVGLPNSPENFLITQFIKDVFLDSQVTVGLLSNVPAGVVDPPGAKAPRNIKEAQAGEILTAAQTAAARDFVNRISRLAAHAGARPAVCGQGQSRLHPPAGRGTQARFLEGLQHRHFGQGGQRPAEPDAPVASRRRGRGLSHLRADPVPL